MSNITVSVVMVTYKHEQFIRAAVLSVIEQIGDFELELIVADDLSPDHTPDIVNELIANHPYGYRIKYTRHTYNKGMMPNFIWALEQCKGKYVALCDGDDYWTDPYKLQKQVDFLEKNPEYVITGHDVIFVDEHTKTIADSYLGREYKRDASSEELKLGFLIPTLSMVFRAKPVLNEYVEKASLVKNGDTFLTSLIGQYGKYNYMADVMGAYRKHQGGVWSMVNEFTQKRNNISTYTFLLSYYLQKGDVEIAKKIKERLSKDADALLFLAVKSGYSKFFREAYLYYFKTEIGFFDFSKLIYLNKCLLFFLKNRYFKRLNTDIDSGKLPL